MCIRDSDVVADWMIRLLGDTTNPYIIMLVFFLVPFILTQVMSNLATLTIFIPQMCIRDSVRGGPHLPQRGHGPQA